MRYVILAVVVWAGMAAGQTAYDARSERPPATRPSSGSRYQDLLEKMEKSRPVKIEAAKAELKQANDELRIARARKSRQVPELETRSTQAAAKLAALRKGMPCWQELTINELAQGQVGVLKLGPGETIRVQQVLGPADMIVSSYGVVVDQYGAHDASSRPVWLKGIPTAGKIDGATMGLGDLIEVTGAKTYSTVAGGTNTIFVIEPIKPD